MTEFKKYIFNVSRKTHSRNPPTPTDKNTYKTTFKGQTKKNREKTKQKKYLETDTLHCSKNIPWFVLAAKLKAEQQKKNRTD